MAQLPHGYTNHTERDHNHVLKRYTGNDASQRARTEALCLEAFSGELPVPEVISSSETTLTISFVEGAHGQDLMEQGRAKKVLFAAGEVLRKVHGLQSKVNLPGSTETLVHGDFGPQNLLCTRDGSDVVAVLDWEWAHYGDGTEDLAWAEWIVRMHHPTETAALAALFEGYGARPPWLRRRRFMMERCALLREVSSDPWEERHAITSEWAPLPDD
jgi:aminoglycoside phosphotransferase (APT) family kinase protein